MSRTIQVPYAGSNSATQQRPRPVTGSLWQRLHQLREQFILHASLILLLAGILTLIGATSLARVMNDLNTINSGSIPSVDAALSITQSIDLIDAQSADYLAAANLTSTLPCKIKESGTSSVTQMLTTHDCDEHDIDSEIVLVNQQLFEAAHNVTYPGEQTAVERVTIGLESYLGDIHQMRVAYGLAKSKTDAHDPSLQEAYQAYMNASAILHNSISLATLGTGQIPLNKESNLPSCTLTNGQQLTADQWTQGGLTDALDCLSFINYLHLTGAYNDSVSFLADATRLLVGLCVLFCCLLLFAAGRMLITTHRLINPGLLPATLIGLFLSFNFVGLLDSLGVQGNQTAQDGAFRQIVMDDYNSIYYATLLQRYGTDANADESRWLIAQEFQDQASIQHWQEDWHSNTQQVELFIHKAHVNQTWVEELQPLQDMDTYWSQYQSLDLQIRNLARQQSNPNWLHDAELLSTGKSNQAFGNFMNAVARLSGANSAHYTVTLNATQQALALSFVLCLLLFPLTGLLALWGIAIRLKSF